MYPTSRKGSVKMETDLGCWSALEAHHVSVAKVSEDQ